MIEIKSMTATFGKLQNETLVCKPGMNIWNAPNEWGKSTWCGFILAMFYGIDTSQRAKAGVIPDKERYKPWSGAPMEGRMELLWDGRPITIQRQSRGRTPMGVFRAWETDSGADVKELTAESCGVKLLGVERSVFQRSAFIRQSDFPITADDALSRRLNALVTTGDEHSMGPALGRYLRDVRNRCRHNQTGQLPQAERKRRELQERLEQMDTLEAQESQARGELRDLADHREKLEAHLAYLDAQDVEAKQQRLNAAKDAQHQARLAVEAAQAACDGLPPRQEVAQSLEALEQRQRQRHRVEGELAALGPAPEPPRPPEVFRGMNPKDAKEYAQRQNREENARQQKQAASSLLILGAGLVLALVGALCTALVQVWCWPLILVGAVLFFMGLRKRKAPVAGSDWTLLEQQAEDYERAQQDYERQLNQWRTQRQRMELRQKSLAAEEQGPDRDTLVRQLAAWDTLAQAQRDYQSAASHSKALAAVAGDTGILDPNVRDVGLTLGREDTRRALQDNSKRANLLTRQAEQCRGQAMALGDRDTLSATVEQLDEKIASLNDLYAAASFALAALEAAETQLRSRFAPKIAQQAGEYLSRLTDGRYNEVVLESDWNLQLAAQEEATLRPAKLRSDGTLDQTYLALRLAVAKALLPEGTPLILDDAFVRFDDQRLKAALDLLQDQAKSRQILLLSCQSREKELLNPASSPKTT